MESFHRLSLFDQIKFINNKKLTIKEYELLLNDHIIKRKRQQSGWITDTTKFWDETKEKDDNVKFPFMHKV